MTIQLRITTIAVMALLVLPLTSYAAETEQLAENALELDIEEASTGEESPEAVAARMNEETKMLRQESVALSKRLEEVKTSKARAAKKIQSAEKEYVAQHKEKAALEKQNAKLAKELAAIQANEKRMDNEMKKAQMAMQKAQEERRDLLKRMKKSIAKTESQKKALKGMKKEQASFQKETKKLKAQIHAVNTSD